MELRILDVDITSEDIEQKIYEKINFEFFELDKEYDIVALYYNRDLIVDSLNDDVFYEIKKKHFKFIKMVRSIFEKKNIKIIKFYLMGTIIELLDDEINIEIKKSNNESTRNNVIWPCKEIFVYEDGKNKLDNLLFSNQISKEEYESNLEDLKYELSIYENEEEFEYLN